jgi:serine/threonine protein kinase
MCLQKTFYQLKQDFTAHVLAAEPYPFDYGGSADLWKGKWKDGNHGHVQVLAVKVPRAGTDKLTRRLIQEGWVWSRATHPNITPFLGFTFDFHRPALPCLISPYYKHGNITSYLKKYPYMNRLRLISQVADALSYLHDISIIHGDIKSSNILINDEGKASLTDFGLSIILHASGFTTKTTAGTWRFMAPELMAADDIYTRVSKATDVWAFAMTIVEILTGCVPFSHIGNPTKIIDAVLKGGRPERKGYPSIPDHIWRMLERCWALDPTQRPSAKTLSEFFAQVCSASRIPHSSVLFSI